VCMRQFIFTQEFINGNTIKSNRVYGMAIFERGGVKIIRYEEHEVEAWVGGLDGKMVEGGGSKRRVTFSFNEYSVTWSCTGNPKNHQIFCKH
jgi:hypothetical protein